MSPNDWNNSPDPPETDGWVSPNRRRRQARRGPEGERRQVDFAEPRAADPDLSPPEHHPLQRAERPQQPPGSRARTAENGQAMAIFAHLSILFGLPVFLIPMLQRNNELSLHHAKAAGTVYGIFLMCGLISLLTCGMAVPLAMLCYVPALVGLVKASHGEKAGPWGLGDMGERIFSGLEVKEQSA